MINQLTPQRHAKLSHRAETFFAPLLNSLGLSATYTNKRKTQRYDVDAIIIVTTTIKMEAEFYMDGVKMRLLTEYQRPSFSYFIVCLAYINETNHKIICELWEHPNTLNECISVSPKGIFQLSHLFVNKIQDAISNVIPISTI